MCDAITILAQHYLYQNINNIYILTIYSGIKTIKHLKRNQQDNKKYFSALGIFPLISLFPSHWSRINVACQTPSCPLYRVEVTNIVFPFLNESSPFCVAT